MFRTSMPSRTTRALAAGALILSLCATTFAGSANAAPLGDESHDCSSDAHARNAAVHLLHHEWKDFNKELRALASDVRQLQHKKDHDQDSEGAAPLLKNDAREVVANAKDELKDIVSKAREDVRAAIELGTACKDEEEDDEDSTSAAAPAETTGSTGSAETSDLDPRVKDIVDEAILDMQAVVDEASKAVTDMTIAAESKTTTATDMAKVKKEVEKAKADREKAKEDRAAAKQADKAKEKASTKSQNSGNGKAKSGNRHGDERN
jgi:hypothetical protein